MLMSAVGSYAHDFGSVSSQDGILRVQTAALVTWSTCLLLLQVHAAAAVCSSVVTAAAGSFMKKKSQFFQLGIGSHHGFRFLLRCIVNTFHVYCQRIAISLILLRSNCLSAAGDGGLMQLIAKRLLLSFVAWCELMSLRHSTAAATI